MALPRQILCSLGAFAASTACVAGMATAATAGDFVPQQQGEINVGLGCLDGVASCLELDPIFASIESLTDATSGTQSRLFVDYFGAGDEVMTYGSGDDTVRFKTKDAGTNSMGYWLRPSERSVGGGNEETGQLEVGTFRFNFAQTLAELTIDFFDTESRNSTGVLAINGVDLDNPDYVAQGRDGNVVSQTFYNISSLDLKLGLDKTSGTGDGVNFRMSGVPAQDVPEPAAAVGLLAIAGLGFFRRQRGQANKA
jgi:hypothetical protein